MKTKCPNCGYKQEPNVTVGDLDVCDKCNTEYMMYENIVNE